MLAEHQCVLPQMRDWTHAGRSRVLLAMRNTFGWFGATTGCSQKTPKRTISCELRITEIARRAVFNNELAVEAVAYYPEGISVILSEKFTADGILPYVLDRKGTQTAVASVVGTLQRRGWRPVGTGYQGLPKFEREEEE